jgi:hypothetical protein
VEEDAEQQREVRDEQRDELDLVGDVRLEGLGEGLEEEREEEGKGLLE